MSYRLPALALTLCVLTFAACKKDDAETLRPAYRKMLIAGPWKLAEHKRFMRVDDNRVDTTDMYKALSPCDTDNVFRFSSIEDAMGGEMFGNEGLILCDSAKPQVMPVRSWSIPQEAATTMIISDGSIGDVYFLNKLSDSVLRITRSLSFDSRTNKVEGRILEYHRAF